MNKIYLARMMTLDSADAFDKVIAGEHAIICSNVNAEAEYEHMTFSYNESLANINPLVREKLEENKAEAEKAHVYFMYGRDLHETMQNLAICALQPQSEDAIERIARGNPNRDDFLARNFVAICVFEIPEEEFYNWQDQALLATNEGNENYETLDGARVSLSEAVLGEVVIKKAIEQGCLTHFGQSHQVYEVVGLSERVFDPYNVFDRGFVPQHPVGVGRSVAKAEVVIENNPYAGTDLENLYTDVMGVDITDSDREQLLSYMEIVSNLSGQDREDGKQSLIETISYVRDGFGNTM